LPAWLWNQPWVSVQPLPPATRASHPSAPRSLCLYMSHGELACGFLSRCVAECNRSQQLSTAERRPAQPTPPRPALACATLRHPPPRSQPSIQLAPPYIRGSDVACVVAQESLRGGRGRRQMNSVLCTPPPPCRQWALNWIKIRVHELPARKVAGDAPPGRSGLRVLRGVDWGLCVEPGGDMQSARAQPLSPAQPSPRPSPPPPRAAPPPPTPPPPPKKRLPYRFGRSHQH